jgi:hypothetical protein
MSAEVPNGTNQSKTVRALINYSDRLRRSSARAYASLGVIPPAAFAVIAVGAGIVEASSGRIDSALASGAVAGLGATVAVMNRRGIFSRVANSR